MNQTIQHIYEQTKKAIMTTAVVASISTPMMAQAGTTEIMRTQDATTIDQKVGYETPVQGLGLFHRNRVTLSDGSTGYFGLTDATLDLGKGASAVVETQYAPGMDTEFRIGGSMYKKIGPVRAYIQSTTDGDDIETLIALDAKTPLTQDVDLVFRGEHIMREQSGDDWSVTRARAGVSKDSIEVGFGIDTASSSSPSVGVYGLMRF